MRNLIIYAVIFCTLQACSSAPTVQQAREQAQINKIIAASLDDRLLSYYALQNC